MLILLYCSFSTKGSFVSASGLSEKLGHRSLFIELLNPTSQWKAEVSEANEN